MHFQYRECIIATSLTVSTAGRDADGAISRSGGSPINVRVTASADLEIDRKLYPPSRHTATFPLARFISMRVMCE